jgi:hypothetical protein
MLPDAGKIEFSHACSSLGVNLDAVKGAPPGTATFDKFLHDIETLIGLSIDLRITGLVLLCDND